MKKPVETGERTARSQFSSSDPSLPLSRRGARPCRQRGRGNSRDGNTRKLSFLLASSPPQTESLEKSNKILLSEFSAV